ncbi:putative RNA-directed DNA polymerase from transposon X-element-like Protein [Tribolium castaneum]|uniref:Putative RNA-directed DNA polymerase from transposon X-element-like Protein n=1 Tax=Tribolium castaneum TaxID=7070 RepID=D7GXQ8_TRICA|nr:putative RNA-directed DNA polymerase from transposon X-element-like Protein [Tribolium castaneum]
MDFKAICVIWNANSVKQKIDELIAFLHSNNVDILAISETKLTPNDRFYIQNYNIIRQDRVDGTNAAGGVAILVKKGISFSKLTLPRTTIEAVGIKLANQIHFIAIYNRPYYNISQRDLENLNNIGNKVIIAGDFNATHNTRGCHRNNTSGNTIYNLSVSNNIIINHPRSPTHFPSNNSTPTVIDLILTKNFLLENDPQSLSQLNSDHNPVIFEISNLPKYNDNRQITSFKNTNWHNFRKDLDNKIQINHNILTTEQLEHEINKFTKSIQKIRKKHSITRIVTSLRKDKIPDNIVNIIKTRNRAKKRMQVTGDTTIKPQITALNSQIKNLIREHKNNIWQTKLASLNPNDNSLWKMTLQVAYFF